MFKYLVVLALALVAVMAAPPAPGAPGPAPKDLQAANQLLYTYGGYPSYYAASPYAYTAGYAYSPYTYGGVYYG